MHPFNQILVALDLVSDYFHAASYKALPFRRPLCAASAPQSRAAESVCSACSRVRSRAFCRPALSFADVARDRGIHTGVPGGSSRCRLRGDSQADAAPIRASRVKCAALHASGVGRRSLLRGLPHPAMRRPGGVSPLLRSGSSVPPQAAPARALSTRHQNTARSADGRRTKKLVVSPLFTPPSSTTRAALRRHSRPAPCSRAR
ncbi:MAG: hypothetical protein RLZZ227_159 [Pseudomonadota bacterium]